MAGVILWSALVAAATLLLSESTTANPIWGLQGSIGRNIRHLPCVSRKTGEAGTCMFAFSCAKANGTHLGTCIDRFYFGSCCKVPEGSELEVGLVEDNHLGLGEVEPSSTQRIRPAITQKRPTSTVRPSTSTISSTIGSISSWASSPRPASTWPSSSTLLQGSSQPVLISTNVPNTRPSTQPTTRPTTPKPSTSWTTPVKPVWVSTGTTKPQLPLNPTTAPPTFVTWTTLEEASSRPPSKPLGSSVAPETHRPTIVTSSGTVISPTKRPSTTSKPKPKPSSKPSTAKPARPPTKPTSKPVKPAVSTSRPAAASTASKPPSTTWVPVSVSTHAPSTTKKPIPSKKPVTSKPVSSTAEQSVVNVLEVSSTAKPLISSTRPESSSTRPPTTKPVIITKPTVGATVVSSTSTWRPPVSSTRPPSVSSSTLQTTTTTAPVQTNGTSVLTVMSSTALPSVSVTSTSAPGTGGSSTSGSTTSVSPTPDSNEVESFNMTNYKEVCGRRLFPEARIVGGQLSSFGKWPWQISLRQWRTSTYLHKCGAALLNENWAITAAHCVENVPPSDLLLRLGEHDLSTEEEPYGFQERRVQIVASHPQFDARTFEYDLALLRFYEPVTFQPNIIPICVPEDDTNFVGSMAFVTGWGRLYEDGPLPSILQEVSVPVINNTICETMYRAAGYIEHIPDIFICAGWKKGGFDSCEGDSGGPMVIQRPDRRWLLAGVISWGIGCAEPNQPGVYTRISQFRHWINQILQF